MCKTRPALAILNEDDAKSQLNELTAEVASLEATIGQTARKRPVLTGDVLADLDAMLVFHACLRVDARVAARPSGQHEGNRSRPAPVRQPAKPDDSPPPPPPARPPGGTVSLTDLCRIANAPRLALEEAERAKARAVLDKLDNDRQAALDARKAAAIAAAAEHRRLNPTMTELCERAKAGQS